MRYVTRKHGNLLDNLPKLGPAITETVPQSEQAHGPPLKLDVKDDQNLNSKYVLSGQQREIIKTGDAIERSDQNDNILQKRDRLPDRIQHLIDDIALLCDSPYFSADRWEEGHVERKGKRSKWANLATELQKSDSDLGELDPKTINDLDETEVEYYETPFESSSELWKDLIDVDQRSQQVRNDVFFAGGSVIADETQFGYEVGSLLQMLRPVDEDDPIGMDLIWGFILAFIGQSRIDIEKERKILNEVISEMNDRHEARTEEADLIPDLQEIMEHRTEGYRMTAEVVEEEGIEPHPIVVEEVLFHQVDFDNEDYHKSKAKETLSEIEDVVPLRIVDDLYSRLAADITAIQTETTQEIDSVKSVIEAFQTKPVNKEASTGESFSVGSHLTADIASSVGVRKAAVTPVLKRLSGDSGTEGWTTTPIVVNKEGGRSWRLTTYGTLLLHIIQNHNGDPSGMYRFAIGPEEISLQDRKLILEVLDEQGDIVEPTS